MKNDLRKLKGKEIVENASQIPSATTIAPSMFKLDLVPLPPSELDFACKYAIYVQDTCPNAITHSSKKIAITPMNNVKKVKFVEPITSSSKTQQVESSKTSNSNTPVLSSTGVKCSTSNCRSKPLGNKKNDRISQPPSRNKKNKVEAQPRKVSKLNRVVKPVFDVDVKHSLSNANSDIICATCNKSMFDGVHDKLPPKQTTPHSVEIQKPEIKVYSRKPKNVRNLGSSKVANIVESKNANHSEPNQIWGSNATDIPSSSSLVMTGTVRFGNDQIARIMGYGDYQLGNVVISRLAKDGLARGIPRLKFQKDHLCSACALGKSKKTSHQPKAEDTNQ
ncbi:hypothetical protein Tco_0191233 [Tanacetum coccineum]